jgi:uracil-DNA glycosylase
MKTESDWDKHLNDVFELPFYKDLELFLKNEITNKQTIFPPFNQIFTAFKATSFESVKVVILGQDPYHGEGQAHGLAFSVNKNHKIPPSLKNIYKELRNDLGFVIPDHGNLENWAKNGVLLLNATLTVRAHEAGSHQRKGWEEFTDVVIKKISDLQKNCVFILWGNYAKSKSVLIDRHKHLVLEAAHPSPLSAHNGFFGCKHFSKCNSYLVDKGLTPIDWQIN